MSRPPTSISTPLEHWDLVIQPHSYLLDLKLGDFWHYRDLVLLFVRRDFVLVYKQPYSICSRTSLTFDKYNQSRKKKDNIVLTRNYNLLK
jgi:hypothetical protein